MLENSSAMVVEPEDNVAVLLGSTKKGQEIEIVGDGRVIDRITAQNDIPVGHKVALSAINSGAIVRKYGEPIGLAESTIEKGEHVHIHNVKAYHSGLGVTK